MYNGVGVSTPRGTGTSGYVQKSLAFYKPKYKASNYKEVLNSFKENPTPVRKVVNEDILKHEILHKIESQLYSIKMKNKDLKEDELSQLLKKERNRLENEYLKKDITDKNTHAYNLLQERKNEKLKEAFKVKDDYISGEAFDTELQEEKRIKRKQELKKHKKEKEKEKIKVIAAKERRKERQEKKEKEKNLLHELELKERELKEEIIQLENFLKAIQEKERIEKKENNEKVGDGNKQSMGNMIYRNRSRSRSSQNRKKEEERARNYNHRNPRYENYHREKDSKSNARNEREKYYDNIQRRNNLYSNSNSIKESKSYIENQRDTRLRSRSRSISNSIRNKMKRKNSYSSYSSYTSSRNSNNN